MASPSQPTTMGSGGDEKNHDDDGAEKETSTGGGRQLVMPEDGYEWRKYGQKFIKDIQKIRSYFRCRDKRCGARKKVEWHPRDPSSSVRVVYDGAHQHGPSAGDQGAAGGGGGGGGGGGANQYDLSVQYFGGPRTQ